jgi:hypothetical protein
MPVMLVRPVLLLLAVAAAVAFVAAPPAAACPFCDGGPSGVNDTRAEVFGPAFWPNALAAAAPFAVLLGVVAAVRFAPPPGRAAR